MYICMFKFALFGCHLYLNTHGCWKAPIPFLHRNSVQIQVWFFRQPPSMWVAFPSSLMFFNEHFSCMIITFLRPVIESIVYFKDLTCSSSIVWILEFGLMLSDLEVSAFIYWAILPTYNYNFFNCGCWATFIAILCYMRLQPTQWSEGQMQQIREGISLYVEK